MGLGGAKERAVGSVPEPHDIVEGVCVRRMAVGAEGALDDPLVAPAERGDFAAAPGTY